MNKIARLIFALCFALCAGLVSPFAFAHPHAFIAMQTKILLENQQFTGFQLKWKLDEASSAEILYDLKQKQNDAKASQALADEIMQNVVGEHYFSYLYNQQDEPVKFRSKPANYGLKAEGNQVLYYFDVLLAKPQPLSNNSFSLLIYDPTYYVSMYYPTEKGAQALDFSALPAHCRGSLIEPHVDQKIQQYASSLDRDQRDEDNSLGALFAQKVRIKCQ